MHLSVEMFKLSQHERNICQFFVVRGALFYKKSKAVIKQRQDCLKYVYNTTGFSHPH